MRDVEAGEETVAVQHELDVERVSAAAAANLHRIVVRIRLVEVVEVLLRDDGPSVIDGHARHLIQHNH